MRILFVVPYTPSLIRVRPYNLIKYLAKQGHEIVLFTLWESEEDLQNISHLKETCQFIEVIHLQSWRSYLNSVLTLPTRMPLQSTYCWHPQLLASIVNYMVRDGAGKEIDIIHIEHLRGVKYGLELKKFLGINGFNIPIVWDSVDSISLLFKQASKYSQSLFGRVITQLELGKTEKYEEWLLGQFDRILVTSQEDKNALQELRHRGKIPDDHGEGDVPLEVLTNGVDLEFFKPELSELREYRSIVLVGKLSYHANVTMVMHFVNEIMPMVWAKMPDVKVYIVGKDPPAKIRNLSRKLGIEVTGTVGDIRPYLHKATISVAPIVYGAGIQNKVLEAMASGVPVVATPQAISALKVRRNEDLLVAKDPRDFALAVVGLLNDPILQTRLSTSGRRYVEENHDWDNIVGDLERIYGDTVTERVGKNDRQTVDE